MLQEVINPLYSLSVWYMACTANHNHHLVAKKHYILTTQGGGNECTRPTPIQLAMLQ